MAIGIEVVCGTGCVVYIVKGRCISAGGNAVWMAVGEGTRRRSTGDSEHERVSLEAHWLAEACRGCQVRGKGKWWADGDSIQIGVGEVIRGRGWVGQGGRWF